MHWSWEAPEFTPVGYRVQQTESATSTASLEDGFGNDVKKSAKGNLLSSSLYAHFQDKVMLSSLTAMRECKE